MPSQRTDRIIYARLETSSFAFDVVAHTEQQARDLLRAAWYKHQGLTGATYEWSDVEDSVNYREMAPYVVHRDGTRFLERGSTCPDCGGNGWPNGNGFTPSKDVCATCKGTGVA